jgi:hypothetical protein
MRKVVGVLVAASLMLPVAAIIGTEAGAATATTVCKTLTGKQTYTPSLPKLGVATKVTSTVASTSKLGGCVGGGVTSATISAKSKYVGNCTTFVAGFAKPTKGTASIKWNTGQTSTVATTLTSKSKVGQSPVIALLVSKFTAGLFVGHSSTVTIKATSAGGTKTCISLPLVSFTFVNSGTFKNS